MSFTLKKDRGGLIEGTVAIDTFCKVCYLIVGGLGLFWLAAMVLAILG